MKYVLIGHTLLFYFVVSPFILWPMIFDSSSYRGILRHGRRAGGRIVSVGEKGAEHVLFGGEPHTCLETEVEVREGGGPWIVNHRALVPDDKLNSVLPGMDVSVRVSPGDRDNIAVEWDRVVS